MKFGNSTNQLFKQSKFFALAFAITVVSCKGPEGEVGPKGDTGATGVQGPTGESFEKAYENGFIKGTIKGVRKDGTAFEEPFEYKISTDAIGFEKISSTEHSINLWRSKSVSEDNSYAQLSLQVANKDQAGATAKLNGAYFEFTKELANKNLFYIGAGPSFVAKNVTLPISKANNSKYKLVDYGIDTDYFYDNSQSYTVFKDTDGNRIYFANTYYSDYSTGSYSSYRTFSYIINSNGVKSTTSETWSNVRLYDGNKFRTSTGTDLSETINVPADTQDITNFTYNATTGLLTFDYKLVISEYRAFDNAYENFSKGNTTMHPLEITGSFSGTVYNGIVTRKSFE